MAGPSAIQKVKLSGSTDGRNIKVVATADPGTTIHTAQSGTTTGSYDEVYLYAINTSSSAVTLTVEYGGNTSPDDLIAVSIPPTGSTPTIVIDGWLLQNSDVVKAYAGTANVVLINGYVNRITN